MDSKGRCDHIVYTLAKLLVSIAWRMIFGLQQLERVFKLNDDFIFEKKADMLLHIFVVFEFTLHV